MTRMRVIAVLVMVVVGWFGAAGVARADEQTFLDAVAALGYTDPADALSAGYAVCSLEKAVGSSITERILRRVLDRLDEARHSDNVNPFSQAAKDYLC